MSKLKKILAIILCLSIIPIATLATYAAELPEVGTVLYNQDFGPTSNVEHFNDAGLVYGTEDATADITDEGYLSFKANTDTTVYQKLVLPDVLPDDLKDYTIDITFRWTKDQAMLAKGLDCEFGAGYAFGETHIGNSMMTYPNPSSGNALLRKYNTSGQKIPKAGTDLYKSTADAYGAWVNVRYTIVNGYLSTVYITIAPGETNEVKYTFNKPESSTIKAYGGSAYLSISRTAVEVKNIKLVSGCNYTEELGVYATASWSDVMSGGVTIDAPDGSVYRGAQVSTKEGDTTFKTRFIATIDDYTKYSSVGFDIQLGGNSVREYKCQTVYSSVCGTLETGTTKVYSAVELGGNYIYCITINNMKVSENYEIIVTPFVYRGSEKISGASYKLTYANGDVVSSALVEG